MNLQSLALVLATASLLAAGRANAGDPAMDTNAAPSGAESVSEASAAQAPAEPAIAILREEEETLRGTIEERPASSGGTNRVLVERDSGRRLVLPAHERQLPAGFTWGVYPNEVELRVVLLYRTRDGKPQTIVKRILDLKAAEQGAPAAAAP